MQPYNAGELDLDPATMAAFLGETARGLAEIDHNIVERSNDLLPKRGIFEQTARDIMHTAVNRTPPRVMPQNPNQMMHPNHNHPPQMPQRPAPVPQHEPQYNDQGAIVPTGSMPLIPMDFEMPQQFPITPMNTPFIDKGQVPVINTDPNQMEFDFSNSVTAMTINNNIADLKKKILALDSKIQMLIECFNDIADSE